MAIAVVDGPTAIVVAPVAVATFVAILFVVAAWVPTEGTACLPYA